MMIFELWRGSTRIGAIEAGREFRVPLPEQGSGQLVLEGRADGLRSVFQIVERSPSGPITRQARMPEPHFDARERSSGAEAIDASTSTPLEAVAANEVLRVLTTDGVDVEASMVIVTQLGGPVTGTGMHGVTTRDLWVVQWAREDSLAT